MFLWLNVKYTPSDFIEHPFHPWAYVILLWGYRVFLFFTSQLQLQSVGVCVCRWAWHPGSSPLAIKWHTCNWSPHQQHKTPAHLFRFCQIVQSHLWYRRYDLESLSCFFAYLKFFLCLIITEPTCYLVILHQRYQDQNLMDHHYFHSMPFPEEPPAR